MRIAVMGSGGIGGYLGARLAQAGEDVIFIARGSHLEAMQQKGLRVESPLGEIAALLMNITPPDIDDPGANNLWELLKTGHKIRGLGEKERRIRGHRLTEGALHLLGRHFQDPVVCDGGARHLDSLDVMLRVGLAGSEARQSHQCGHPEGPEPHCSACLAAAVG